MTFFPLIFTFLAGNISAAAPTLPGENPPSINSVASSRLSDRFGFDFDSVFVPKLAAPSSAGRTNPASIGSVIVQSAGAAQISPAALFDRLAKSQIVYVGEEHTVASHHLVQLAVLKGFFKRHPNAALGIEMLDRTQQAELDGFISGSISEEDFAEFWNSNWIDGTYPIYQPIFDFASQNHIPIFGLNVPRDIVHQVQVGGLDSLSPADRAELPPQIHPIKDPRYRAYVVKALKEHQINDPAEIDRWLTAQQTWNEAMAQRALEVTSTGRPLVVIAGMGHMLYDSGIPECVRNQSAVGQSVVLPYPLGQAASLQDLLSQLQNPRSRNIHLADYFWLLPK